MPGMRSRLALVLVALAVGAPVPASASGESLLVSPGSGSAGTVVRLTYSMNGGCGQQEVAEFFFDANPVGHAPVDQQSCRAVLRYTVPATSCTAHPVSAAWHYRGSEQLYGLASSRFAVTRRGSTCRVPTPSPTTPVARTSKPTPTRTSAPPPTRRPVSRQSVVPVVTTAPPTVAARPPEPVPSGGGLPTAVWLLAGLGALGGLVVIARRWGPRPR
jgi:hypothetical protein